MSFKWTLPLLGCGLFMAIGVSNSADHYIFLYNHCQYQIWPGALPFAESEEPTLKNNASNIISGDTAIGTNQQMHYIVPAQWSGSIWARMHGG